MSEQSTQEQISFILNGKTVTVPKGTTVYHAATSQGIDIPIFCYQDRMPPFGACRVCLVEVEKMPKLQTSCTLVATEGMVVNTQSEMAAQGREEILEFLLINHPLDCPICDRGGECPLQDQTMKFGPERSRFYEEKRHFKKPIPLGPVLMLDRERCIACARCTRFSDIISGDHALEFIDRGFRTEVGTPDGAPVDSKFIGNTIMICPVGALTSQVYRFRARPWDNTHTKTTCTLCPVGCSMILDSRDGEVMRTRSLGNKDVNDVWLCDKGWFGYEFTDHDERLQKPLIRRNGKLVPTSWEEALAEISSKFKAAKSQGKIAGWGGDPLTFEENYLFQKLIREGGGVNNVDHRVGQPLFSLEEEGLPPGMEISIGECEHLSFAVLLGVDLTEEFPVIWLRLKQGINNGAQVGFIGHYTPEISQHLEEIYLHAPGQEINIIRERLAELPEGKGALFVGRQYLESPHRKAILAELLKHKRPNLSINVLEGRGNSKGARLAGMRPDLGPFNEQISQPGLSVHEVLKKAASEGWDYLHVAGADPASRLPAKLWAEARSKIGFLVVQDPFLTETAKQADVVLPTLTYVEKEGSFVNIEGRIQRLTPGKAIPEAVFSDAVIFSRIAQQLNVPLVLDRSFREKAEETKLSIPRNENFQGQVHAESPSNGKLKATFAKVLFDQGVRMMHDPHLSQLTKHPKVRLHPNEAAKNGLQENEKIKISSEKAEVYAHVHLDDSVAEGTVVLPIGFKDIPVYDFELQLLNGLEVEIVRE